MAYCTLQDVRDEGLSASDASDATVTERIEEATMLIDRVTGWWFEPRTYSAASPLGVLRLTGRGLPWLHLPVMGTVAEVRIVRRVVSDSGDNVETLEAKQWFTLADWGSRFNPRLILKTGAGSRVDPLRTKASWERGRRNIEVDGTFGFQETDPDDGSQRTPLVVRRAAIGLVTRLISQMTDIDDLEEQGLGTVRSIRVADRSESYGGRSGKSSSMTGYVEIDRMLHVYRDRRPFWQG